MSEKYLIFNRADPLTPIFQSDINFNSGWLELEKDKAIKFVNENNKKEGSEQFYFLSVFEHLKRIEKMMSEGEFNKCDEAIEDALNNSSEYSKLRKELDAFYEERDEGINGFSLPAEAASNDDYKTKLKEMLDSFICNIDKPAFKLYGNLYEEVKSICKMVMDSLDLAVAGRNYESEAVLAELLSSYITHEFAVSELDKSYAFRGLAPFTKLHSPNKEDYDLMLGGDISFFRGRPKNKTATCEISTLKDICSLPYSKRHLSNDLRFSSKGNICLYLGTTSYVCSRECRWDESSQDLYMAAFRFNEKGKKLKILNLVISELLINGIYNRSIDGKGSCKQALRNAMIKLFPLVIATSFTIKTDDEVRKKCYGESEKFEYLLTQRLIKAIKLADIDGVAYLSRQGENDLQYPHGVNLAIPMSDVSENKEYSNLYEYFEMTQPISLNEDILSPKMAVNEMSYINKHYPEFLYSCPDVLSQVHYQGENIFYGKTPFSKLDNYLINQKFEKFEE